MDNSTGSGPFDAQSSVTRYSVFRLFDSRSALANPFRTSFSSLSTLFECSKHSEQSQTVRYNFILKSILKPTTTTTTATDGSGLVEHSTQHTA